MNVTEIARSRNRDDISAAAAGSVPGCPGDVAVTAGPGGRIALAVVFRLAI